MTGAGEQPPTAPNVAPPSGGAPWYPQADRAPKAVSFYVAIFLGLLLVISIGLNLLLLLVSAVGSLTEGIATGSIEEEAGYQVVQIGGERDAPKQILRIPIEGAIAELPSPILGAAGGTVSQVRRNLRLAGREGSVAGVLFDINSPGGGVADSDEVYRLIREFRAEHPDKVVIALLGETAASGGYYIAAACQHIMARPTAITGSIGVIMQTWNFAEAMDNLGIEQVTITSERTPYKDLLSFSRPPSEAEKALLRSIVEELYDRFVTVVDDGRPNMNRAEVVAAATGAIYSAQQARDLGLVDGIGSIDDAVAFISAYEAVGPATLVEQRRLPGLMETLFGVRRVAPQPETALGKVLSASTGSRFLYFWPGGR